MGNPRQLKGAVCVVTGASRGAGRGIAEELGAAGAMVYVTGRSMESLEETAARVRAEGGGSRAVPCDHTVDHEVAAVFELVRRDHGRLDILVNNAWGGYEDRGESVAFFDAPFFEQPLWRWDAMFGAGVRASYVSSWYGAPLMLEHGGLIVNTMAWAYGAYLGNVLYDTAKAATARLAVGIGEELRPHRVAAVALALGHLGVSESARYGGRAVVALACADDLFSKSGRSLTAGDLAVEYGFTDVDGTQPKPFALT
jgi:NAD(P)-dependent dehydrogenase (short-subunit alcohol dehydrogenase family)